MLLGDTMCFFWIFLRCVFWAVSEGVVGGYNVFFLDFFEGVFFDFF